MSTMVIESCRGVAASSKLFWACSHPTPISVRSWQPSLLHRQFFQLLGPGWLCCIPIFHVCMCWSAPRVPHILIQLDVLFCTCCYVGSVVCLVSFVFPSSSIVPHSIWSNSSCIGINSMEALVTEDSLLHVSSSLGAMIKSHSAWSIHFPSAECASLTSS
jgi:hypothetical protein